MKNQKTGKFTNSSKSNFLFDSTSFTNFKVIRSDKEWLLFHQMSPVLPLFKKRVDPLNDTLQFLSFEPCRRYYPKFKTNYVIINLKPPSFNGYQNCQIFQPLISKTVTENN